MDHGGRIVAKALKSRGVSHLFTLSGGHLFSIYDGCRAEKIEIVDVRHEQSAAFAAEGFAKATRQVGAAALTAGPGVTNGISALASAQANRSPICVLGGRAPELRWGSGSLQEIDHLPFVAPLVKSAETVKEGERIGAGTAAALDLALAAPSGPTFVDYPLDVVFSEAEPGIPDAAAPEPKPAERLEEAAALLAGAERPAIMAGTGLYWGHGEDELRALAEALGAKLAHPDRQVCLLLGDGAFGFAGMEFDTLARHGLPVVGVMGNNGIWALEHHPMKSLYGYSVAAELRPETPYEKVVEALGCEGVVVSDPEQLRPALERAFESRRPTLVNVLTDPEVVYPRKSNLA
jgi:thiamine pyrophosphate-dependent acetolactate synthase large subunit-like protein